MNAWLGREVSKRKTWKLQFSGESQELLFGASKPVLSTSQCVGIVPHKEITRIFNGSPSSKDREISSRPHLWA